MAKGFLYVLRNDAFPDLLKIGYSVKVPTERAAELFSTGVPDPFHITYYCLVENAKTMESEIHSRLSSQRHREEREFFRTELEIVVKLIKSLCSPEHEYYGKGIQPISQSLEFDGSGAYGIKIISRHGIDYEVEEMVNFAKLAHERCMTRYIRSVFYDSNSGTANIELAVKVKWSDPLAEEVKDIALETISQFDWFDMILHGKPLSEN